MRVLAFGVPGSDMIRCPITAKENEVENVSKMSMAASSMRPGKTTSEFKGKTSVQALFILVVILQRFGVDVSLDEQTALLIIAGLEAAYTFGRSIVKGFQARAVADGPVVNHIAPTANVSHDQRGPDVKLKGES